MFVVLFILCKYFVRKYEGEDVNKLSDALLPSISTPRKLQSTYLSSSLSFHSKDLKKDLFMTDARKQKFLILPMFLILNYVFHIQVNFYMSPMQLIGTQKESQ